MVNKSKKSVLIGVISLFLVMLLLLGLTYAYYRTRIIGNTSNKLSIDVQGKKLEIRYVDGTSTVNMDGDIKPGFKYEKTFSVENTGDDAVDFSIYLEDVINEFKRTQDWLYLLTCVDNNGKECLGTEIREYPIFGDEILKTSIDKNTIQTFTLTITYADSEEDQSEDMGAMLAGKIQIYSPEDVVDIEGVVAAAEDGDYIQINSVKKVSRIVDGKYKLSAVQAGNHTLSLRKINGDIKAKTTIEIQKKEKASVSGSVISISNNSQTAILNINNISEGSKLEITIEKEIVGDYEYLGEHVLARAITARQLNEKNKTKITYSDALNLNAITSISTRGYRQLGVAEDDYGTSYVFRGTILDNYVKFAGFIWRIVRINGDGTVRLILEGTLDKVKREGNDQYAGVAIEFNLENWTDNAHVGYMYGLAETTTDKKRCLFLENNKIIDKIDSYSNKEICESKGGKWAETAYDASQVNLIDSTMKTHVDAFYENYIENNENNYHYGHYLADSIFCVDKTLSKDGIVVSKQYGYGSAVSNETYYGAVGRLFKSSGTTNIVEAHPTLKCAEGVANDFSRFTADKQNINGVITNGDLKYPIAGLSIDELVMAGSFRNTPNHYYYLSDAYYNGFGAKAWWLITPHSHYSGYVFSTVATDPGATAVNQGVWQVNGIRPVINLKKDVLVIDGDGTESNPYIIKKY